ncbi:hypothetical protein, partial [Mesorhizobium sp. M0500]|uniref:hypothetical protein n=1 Tax=Mesorhizobium sp. M0500 TaxID=2956953 RepID=UPI003336AF2D
LAAIGTYCSLLSTETPLFRAAFLIGDSACEKKILLLLLSSRRKLMVAVYSGARANMLPAGTAILAISNENSLLTSV